MWIRRIITDVDHQPTIMIPPPTIYTGEQGRYIILYQETVTADIDRQETDKYTREHWDTSGSNGR